MSTRVAAVPAPARAPPHAAPPGARVTRTYRAGTRVRSGVGNNRPPYRANRIRLDSRPSVVRKGSTSSPSEGFSSERRASARRLVVVGAVWEVVTPPSGGRPGGADDSRVCFARLRHHLGYTPDSSDRHDYGYSVTLRGWPCRRATDCCCVDASVSSARPHAPAPDGGCRSKVCAVRGVVAAIEQCVCAGGGVDRRRGPLRPLRRLSGACGA